MSLNTKVRYLIDYFIEQDDSTFIDLLQLKIYNIFFPFRYAGLPCETLHKRNL